MSTEAIITIILTVIFGIPSLIIFFRINNAKIVHVEKHIINLKDDLLKNFEDLDIKYKGIAVSNKVHVVNGFLVCHGKKDIDSDASSIEITPTNDSKWLDFKIVASSHGFTPKVRLNAQTANVDFDLFKANEYLQYEGIFETSNEKPKAKPFLKFHHRIPNVSSIEKLTITKPKHLLSLLFIGVLFIVLPGVMMMHANQIHSFDLIPIGATGEEIQDTGLKYSEEFKTLVNNLEKRSKFKLIQEGSTESFNLKYKDWITNDIQNAQVRFTIEPLSRSDWFAIVYSAICFIIALSAFYVLIIFLFQRKYMKVIDQSLL